MKERDSVTVPIRTRSGINKLAAVVGVSDIIDYILRKAGSDGLDSIDLDSLKIEDVETLGLDGDDNESYRIWERDFRDTLDATLVAYARGIHRAFITDALEQKKPLLMTQSDIIRYVNAHPESVTPTVDIDLPVKVSLLKRLSNQRRLITMRDNQSALDGFKIITEKKVAAVPVLDGDGKIVANLSASDLRGITRIGLSDLKKPVLEYLKSTSKQVKLPVVITPEDSLKSVLHLLVDHHIHRVWVVEKSEDLRPIGVISQSDILATFVGVDAR
ncbi:hypothetical protein DFS34DRAFT_574486 [Phlyctochytrium arcticum]|nr:hypothetical protein DFS34DRAFT_574486 [Phlyctochytrium arcticum]